MKLERILKPIMSTDMTCGDNLKLSARAFLCDAPWPQLYINSVCFGILCDLKPVYLASHFRITQMH